MNSFALIVLFIFAYIGYKTYWKSRSPDLLNEIYNGLMHLSYRDTQRGELTSAQRFEKMAWALIEGQAYLKGKPISNINELRDVSRLVLESMNYSVLESCGILRQNHKHACYEAVGRLTEKLEKLVRQSGKQ
jgi:hypothetical protein